MVNKLQIETGSFWGFDRDCMFFFNGPVIMPSLSVLSPVRVFKKTKTVIFGNNVLSWLIKLYNTTYIKTRKTKIRLLTFISR